MRQLKIHAKYLGLLWRKHPFYVCIYIFFELYNTAYVSFKNVYIYTILLGMIAGKKPFLEISIFLLVSFLVVAVMLFLSSAYHEKMEPRIREQLTADLDMTIMDRLADLDIKFYDSEKFHDEYVLSTAGISSKIFQNFTLLVSLIKNIFGIITVVPLLGKIHSLWIGIAVVLFTLISYKVNRKSEDLSYQEAAGTALLKRRTDYINSLFRKKEYVKEMRLNKPDAFLFRQYEKVSSQKTEIIKQFGIKKAVLSVIDCIFLQTFLFDFFYFLYLIVQVFQSKIAIGDFVGAKNTINIIRNAVNGLIHATAQLRTLYNYLQKFDRFSALKNTLSQGVLPVPSPFANLDLKNVCFSYENSHMVLQDIALSIRSGEKIVVVGPNGAGKTTLVKLLMHLYDVDSGSICWNGTDIREFQLKNYYAQFGAAFQEYNVYPTSLYRNVSACRDYQEDQVCRSLNLVGLSYLTRLPKGLDSTLSKELCEEGIDLSGGEKQKLAIARAVYQNSPILILDEPSSALDSISEYDLNQLIDQMADQHTVIVISHRLSAAKNADRILVVKDGRIIESGKHHELLMKNGEYAHMYSAQADQFSKRST